MAYLFGQAHLGRDAELRTTAAGESVASLSLAFNAGKKDREGNRPVLWVDGALWGRRAEALAPLLIKGIAVAVVVEDLVLERYTNRSGQEATKLAGRVISIELPGRTQAEREEAPAPAPRPPARAPARPPANPGPSGFDDMDDDVPF